MDEALIKHVVNLLIELRQCAPPEPHVIESSVRDATDDALDLVSVRGMMETAMVWIRENDRTYLIDGSLQLIARRLGVASTTARKEISGAIISVIYFIIDLLGSSPSDDEDLHLRTSALSALATISATAVPDELATLSKTVLVVANYLTHNRNTSAGLTAMIVLW